VPCKVTLAGFRRPVRCPIRGPNCGNYMNNLSDYRTLNCHSGGPIIIRIRPSDAALTMSAGAPALFAGRPGPEHPVVAVPWPREVSSAVNPQRRATAMVEYGILTLIGAARAPPPNKKLWPVKETARGDNRSSYRKCAKFVVKFFTSSRASKFHPPTAGPIIISQLTANVLAPAGPGGSGTRGLK
jgi:hypothetical protein